MEYVNLLLNSLKYENLFYYRLAMNSAKAVAMSFLVFKIINQYISNNEDGNVKFSGWITLFGYALLITSSEWVIDLIESSLSVVDSKLYTNNYNIFEEMHKEMNVQYKRRIEEAGLFTMFTLELDLIFSLLLYFVLYILTILFVIADNVLTSSVFLIRIFLIELMKFIFPFVIALSTLDMFKDLFAKWVKRFIGLYLLGFAYIGIVNFCVLLRDTMSANNSVTEAGDASLMSSFLMSQIVCCVLIFSFKLKAINQVTSFIQGFFS